jgi:hypothetical protein
MLKSPPGEEPGDKFPDAKVQITVKHDMVTRRQSLKDRQACRHACTEGYRFDSTLQVSQALLERFSIRVVDPAIEEVPRERSIRVALEGGGGIQRCGDGPGSWVHLVSGVNA